MPDDPQCLVRWLHRLEPQPSINSVGAGCAQLVRGTAIMVGPSVWAKTRETPLEYHACTGAWSAGVVGPEAELFGTPVHQAVLALVTLAPFG